MPVPPPVQPDEPGNGALSHTTHPFPPTSHGESLEGLRGSIPITDEHGTFWQNWRAFGQIPEILDGDAPHTQRGCDAQAWGATEALRVWKLLQKS